MNPVYTVDIAHPPRHPDRVEEELLEAWSHVRNSSTLRVLKIVHGYGSHGKGSSTKLLARNWVFTNRLKFRGTIDGEHYTLHDATTAGLRKELGSFDDPDMNAGNPGIVIVWVK
jgi:hypothetical protein